MVRLLVQETLERGRGVYAAEYIFPGVKILDFEGPKLSPEEVPYPCEPADDHYLQVAAERYLGPSGELDDLVNHACNPNAYVLPRGKGAHLRAARLIRPGEEVTFDYALTSTEPAHRWALTCRCKGSQCRGRVVAFPALPKADQDRLARQHWVPTYVALAALQAAKVTTR